MFSLSEKIWSSDWLIALIVGIMLIIGTYHWLQPLQQIAYDWSLRHISHQPSDKIAVIAIDEKSLAQLGQWPWSRTVLAQMIDLLSPYSQVIGTTLPLSQAQKDPGLIYFDELATFYTHSKSLNLLHEQVAQLDTLINNISRIRTRYAKDKKSIKKLHQFYKQSVFLNALPDTLTTLQDKLQAARVDLNSDFRLANSFKQGNVILGMPFMFKGEAHLAPSLPNYIQKQALKIIRAPFDNLGEIVQPPLGVNAKPPIPILGNSVSGIGHFNLEALDARRIPLIVKYQQAYYPSLLLLLAAKSLDYDASHIEIRLTKGVNLGHLQINTDPALYFRPFFYQKGEQELLQVDSYVDVLSGQVPIEQYQDKIVLIGLTAPHYSTQHSTPLGQMPSVLVLGHSLTSLLNEDFFRVPTWAFGLQTSVFILVVVYLGFLLPTLKRPYALMLSAGVFIALALLYFSLLNQGRIVHLMHILLLVPCGHLALEIKRGLVTYQDAFRLHPDAVESNRLLGLAFQGQGHLDLAFEKFRLCPPDDAILGLFYNLALDYELKRQFRRAGAVYRYILSHVPQFRDVQQRQERLYRLRKPRLSTNHFNNWNIVSLDKPVLGRYQIEKPLGKGAMGVVYLGKDSKLNRLVAIKTLPLSEDFEAEQLQEATIRFFREAAAAGRLKHPHIVSIYDAGEEQDLAYISMEFFKGGHLVPYTHPDNLLPISTVFEIIIHVAEALDYAHSQGIVHRDIKPANIMYNPATSQIKITDFGIARITDSNRTKTGAILGTPSYMSPEQLAGKSLDGRTDLFSLGVMLYQLLTGQLPFEGEPLAALMFKIANEPHLDILSVRTDLPPCLKRNIDIALEKEPDHRYQSGAEFANALRDCGQV
jgi:eukaryotic-like serine/threonine-protein kinase